MSALKPVNTQDPQLDSLLGNLGELIRQARLKVLTAEFGKGMKEAATNIHAMNDSPREFIRDPVMLEFLGLPNTGVVLETNYSPASTSWCYRAKRNCAQNWIANGRQLKSDCSISYPCKHGWIVRKQPEDYCWQLPAKVKNR